MTTAAKWTPQLIPALVSEKEAHRELYLAVPKMTYETFFSLQLTQIVVKSQNLKLLVYDPKLEVIYTWINY